MKDNEFNQFEENQEIIPDEAVENQGFDGDFENAQGGGAFESSHAFPEGNPPLPELYGIGGSDKGKFYAFSIASMILGIISITCCCLAGVPIVLAVLAVVFSSLRMSQSPNGFSVAGLVTGIIGLILNGLMLILLFGGNTEFDFTEFESIMESLDDAVRAFAAR